MKKLFLLISLLAVSLTFQAQTKRIAHRSHSGANATFDLSGNDNFGNPYPQEYWENLAKKDDSLHKVDSLKEIGVYPYLYQGGEFAREALKFWGRTILDTTVKRQGKVYDSNLKSPVKKSEK